MTELTDGTGVVHVPEDPDGIVLQNANPYRVGGIFYTSWGYDQTNVEFFEVVRESTASVWVRELSQDWRDGRTFPVPGTGEGSPVSMHRKGKSAEYPGIRFSSYRYAWPYDGGGRYDTAAAGQAGH